MGMLWGVVSEKAGSNLMACSVQYPRYPGHSVLQWTTTMILIKGHFIKGRSVLSMENTGMKARLKCWWAPYYSLVGWLVYFFVCLVSWLVYSLSVSKKFHRLSVNSQKVKITFICVFCWLVVYFTCLFVWLVGWFIVC